MEPGIVAAILAPISAVLSRVTITARPLKSLKVIDGMVATYKSMENQEGLKAARESLGDAISATTSRLAPSNRPGRVEGSHEPSMLLLGMILMAACGWGGWAVYDLGRGWTTWIGWALWIFGFLFAWSSVDIFVRGPSKNRPSK